MQCGNDSSIWPLGNANNYSSSEFLFCPAPPGASESLWEGDTVAHPFGTNSVKKRFNLNNTLD